MFFQPRTYRLSRLRIGSRIALVGATAGAVTLRNDELTGRNFAGIRLAPGAQTLVTLRMSGAQLGDVAVAAFSNDPHGLQLTAYVASNSVTLGLRNGTADAVALSPGRLKVQLLK